MDSFIFSFEEGLPRALQCEGPGTAAIDTRHARDGESALRWTFKPGSKLIFRADIPYTAYDPEAADKARPAFVNYLYCEKALGTRLHYEFFKDEKLCCRFTAEVNFRGWRALWVPFDRDMEGRPEEGMNRLEISAEEAGELWLDQLILSVPIDPRHPTRDAQQPFVNLPADKAANAHWMSLYRFAELEKKAFASGNKEACGGDFSEDVCCLIASRLEAYFKEKAAPSFRDLDVLKEQFASYRIRETDSGIRGRTIDAEVHHACYPHGDEEELLALTDAADVKEAAALLLELSAFRERADKPAEEKEEAGRMFILLTRQLLDQGFAGGSALGTAHHLGYPLRNYFIAMFLERRLLQEKGLLKDIAEAMAWYSGRGRIFRPEAELDHESMDSFNTFGPAMLASVLMTENMSERRIVLGAYKRWLDLTLRPAPGLSGPLKADGSAFHHAGHYPAYAIGGFSSLCPLLYCLSGTPFAVGEAAHALLRKAVLAMRMYSNVLDWPISMSARHPLGRGVHSHISNLDPYRYLALAGSPDGREKIDREMAGAYLRLAAAAGEDVPAIFKEEGLSAEAAPEGHMTMNYAAAALQRRDEWLCTVRGHSRYLWASEIYQQANLYGRYITYGHLEVLNRGTPINQGDSGYKAEGFDFNCFGGTTVVKLPPEQLLADVKNVDRFSGFEEMLLSDESFCGGLTQADGRNGFFAMILHGHPKYHDSLRARKSWFFMDDYVLCLGSGIESKDPEHEVITTLFQKARGAGDTPVLLNGRPPAADEGAAFCAESGTEWRIADNKNCVYIVEGPQTICFSAGLQHSYYPTDKHPTEGEFVKAYLNHGKAPRNAGYTYALRIDGGNKAPENTAELWDVLRRDRDAHIVLNKKEDRTYCCFFSEGGTYGLLKDCSAPALLSLKEEDGTLELDLCDPDLRLYEGKDPEQYDAAGRRIEVSLYSRPWRYQRSREKTLTLRLEGAWSCPEADLKISGSETLLRVNAKDAANYHFKLKRISEA